MRTIERKMERNHTYQEKEWVAEIYISQRDVSRWPVVKPEKQPNKLYAKIVMSVNHQDKD